jgi:hypothetical protein
MVTAPKHLSTLKLGLWMGLHVRSAAWSLTLTGCSSSSIYWHSNLVASADWLRMLAHVTYTDMYAETLELGSSKLRVRALSS